MTMASCSETIGVLVIGIANFVFMLIAITMIVLGGIILFFPVNDLLGVFETETKNQLITIHNQANPGKSTDYIDDWHLNDMLGRFCAGILIAGFVVVTVCLIGCIGAMCRVRIALLIYSLIIGVCVVGQIVQIGVSLSSEDFVIGTTESYLNYVIEEHYKGELYPSNTDTVSWNFVMIYNKCCGVNDYMDFNAAKHWNTAGTQKMPVYCCDPIPESNYLQCTKGKPGGNAEEGCFRKAVSSFENNMVTFVIVALAIILLEVALIVCSCMLYSTSKKNKVGDFNDSDDNDVQEQLPMKY